MAYDYRLNMICDLNILQAKRLLMECLNADMDVDGFVGTNDISISGHDLEPGHWTEVIEECFHFTPTLSMSFREDRGGSYREFYAFMLRAAVLLLKHGRDAVLLANGEHIVFQRLGGALVFNSEETARVEAIIKQEIHIPYELRSLPSPLL